jgi:two-component system chemotaxis response regulator CheB
VVAIAGSLGAISVTGEILSRLPQDFPAAVIVLIHLSPTHRSRLAEVLRRRTRLPTQWAKEGDVIEAGHVYVTQPARHIEIDAEGAIHLTDAPKRHFTRPSAEPLFCTVGRSFGTSALAVILSGYGKNGSESLIEAKRAGMRILIQEPSTATAPGMPTAAIATGAYDEILPVAELAEAIIQFACADGVAAQANSVI